MAKKREDMFTRPKGNASELCEYLGLSVPESTRLKRNGIIVPGSDGQYDLKQACSAVCSYLRAQVREKIRGAKDYDKELKSWKVEAVKQTVREWRLTYGRRLVAALLVRLADTLADFREQTKDTPAIADAVARLRDKVAAVRPEEIAWDVEAEDEDREDKEDEEDEQ